MDGPSYLADDVAAVWCEIMAKVHHTEIENMATPQVIQISFSRPGRCRIRAAGSATTKGA